MQFTSYPESTSHMHAINNLFLCDTPPLNLKATQRRL